MNVVSPVMALSDLIPRKSIEFDVQPIYELKEIRPFPGWVTSGTETLMEASLTIKVDGQMAFRIPKFREFEVTEAFLDIDKRLKLLEEILRSADVNGTAMIVRSVGGYEVLDAGSYTVMSNDRDDD